jgi:hypothetical protein
LATATRRCMGKNPIGHTRERQALKEDGSSAAECGQKKALTTKKHRFEASGALDVIIDSFGESHQAACIHAKDVIVEFSLGYRSASVNKNFTRRCCRMNPSPPKKPVPKRFVNAMSICVPRAAARKASF